MRTRRHLVIKNPGATQWHLGGCRGAIRHGVAVTPAAPGGSARRRGVVGWQVANTLHLGCRIDADIARPKVITATLLPHKAIHSHTSLYKAARGESTEAQRTPTFSEAQQCRPRLRSDTPAHHHSQPMQANARARPTDVETKPHPRSPEFTEAQQCRPRITPKHISAPPQPTNADRSYTRAHQT